MRHAQKYRRLEINQIVTKARNSWGGDRSGCSRKHGALNAPAIAAKQAVRLLPHENALKLWLLALKRNPWQQIRHRVKAAIALMPHWHSSQFVNLPL